MDRYKETFNTWNEVAHLYEENFMELDCYNSTYNFVCDSIVKNKARILDVGCGPGNISKYLLSKRPDFDVFGIDIAPNMIELAKKNNPTANFAIMDIRLIHKLKTFYDGIVCGFCMPYLSESDCTKLIADCYNLLNKNGLIYLSFVEGETGRSGYQTGNNGYRCYFYYYPEEQIKKKLVEHKFDDLTAFKTEYKKSNSVTEIHTILTARKKIS